MVLIPAASISGTTHPLAVDEEYSDCCYPASYSLAVGSFYMDCCEVTKAQGDEVVNWAASHGYDLLTMEGRGKTPDHPVQIGTWYRAVKGCNARREMEGRTPAYYTAAERTKGTVYRTDLVDVHDDWIRWDIGYHLPTSEEWEYAAWGGASSRRIAWGGDTIGQGQANYRRYWEDNAPNYAYDLATASGYHPLYNDGSTPHISPVGSFAPNAYGLYDMTGNVLEWGNDWHPCHVDTGRFIRGGSWSHYANVHRIGHGPSNDPGGGNFTIGLRTLLPAAQ